MKLYEMYEISETLNGVNLEKGGIKTAFLELPKMAQQKLIELATFEDKTNFDLLFQKYNYEMSKLEKLVKKEKKDTKKEKKDTKKLTDYDIILDYVYYMGKIGISTKEITISGAYILLEKYALENTIESLMKIPLDKDGNLARKINIKHTDMTDIDKVKELITKFNG